jgi:hypothetical protein
VVLVSGAAGIGTSALLGWARDCAEGAGWRTGLGAAATIEGAWPYAPVLEALADLCRRHPALLDGLDDRYRGEIELALAATPEAWSGEGGHQRLFVAAAELLRLAAAGTGLLLVVDEIHDADEASLRLLHHLARAAVPEQVVLALGHRTAASGTALAAFRQSTLSRGAIDLPLTPLAPETVETLVHRIAPGASSEDVAEICSLADGSPFAAVELARSVRRGDRLAGSLAAQLAAALAPEAIDTLARVAVAGTTFDSDELLALAGTDEADAFDHLDAALEVGVVEPADAGYRFRHQLLRESLLDRTPPHRRRQLHRDAAARLEALGASPARVGHHLLQAGDSAAAAPHLLRAAETEAAMGAYRDALDLVDAVRAAAAVQTSPGCCTCAPTSWWRWATTGPSRPTARRWRRPTTRTGDCCAPGWRGPRRWPATSAPPSWRSTASSSTAAATTPPSSSLVPSSTTCSVTSTPPGRTRSPRRVEPEAAT